MFWKTVLRPQELTAAMKRWDQIKRENGEAFCERFLTNYKGLFEAAFARRTRAASQLFTSPDPRAKVVMARSQVVAGQA